ncbi:hypothetical protein L1887_21648 [Cichorium endivia]|nr:hypothetical protein L1887_21648 [Cichorium endivia]
MIRMETIRDLGYYCFIIMLGLLTSTLYPACSSATVVTPKVCSDSHRSPFQESLSSFEFLKRRKSKGKGDSFATWVPPSSFKLWRRLLLKYSNRTTGHGGTAGGITRTVHDLDGDAGKRFRCGKCECNSE